MLSTAHRVLDGNLIVEHNQTTNRRKKMWRLPDDRDSVLYKATHINHPSNIWVRSNLDHYRFVFDLLYYLTDEYTRRYGKRHKSRDLLPYLLDAPHNIDVVEWSDPPQAMPDDCKRADTVEAYRDFYAKYKSRFAKWKYTQQPEWYDEKIQSI